MSTLSKAATRCSLARKPTRLQHIDLLPIASTSSTPTSYTRVYHSPSIRPRLSTPTPALIARRTLFGLPSVSQITKLVKIAKFAGTAATTIGGSAAATGAIKAVAKGVAGLSGGSGNDKTSAATGGGQQGVQGQSEDGVGEVEVDGDRQIYHARKILPYSQEQLYHLVADIPSYSSFIPFCTSSNVLQPGQNLVDNQWKPPATQEGFDVNAELKVGFAGFSESYTSRVVGTPFESVQATAGEAPLFKSLSTTWSFAPASSFSPHPSSTIPSTPDLDSTINTAPASETDTSQGPTLLTIDLAFEFANPLHGMASQAVLPKVAGKMVDAFEARCVEVYGQGQV